MKDGHKLKKATDKQLIEAYKELNNIWHVADKFGMCGQSVHNRLKRLKIKLNNPAFTKEEWGVLKKEYLIHRDAGKLELLAKEMNRTKQFLARKAGKIGLTDPRHRKVYISTWKYMSEEVAEGIFEKFKKSRCTMGQFCAKQGYDDLGFSATMRKYFSDEWDHVLELKIPKQSMYRHGRQFEYRCRDDLRKKGYFVMRSPASKSPVDLVAIKKGRILFVQCKRGGALPVKEWNELLELSRSVDAVSVFAMIPPKTQKGVIYYRMNDYKDGSKRRQPMIEMNP